MLGAGEDEDALHRRVAQNLGEQRALDDFRAGKTRVLVATDIAARGIDVDGVSHVIQYELPQVPEAYVHRIGRTARAGAEGIAISFCDSEEVAYLRDIEKIIRLKVPVVTDHPFKEGTPVPRLIEAPREARRPSSAPAARGRRRRPNRGTSTVAAGAAGR